MKNLKLKKQQQKVDLVYLGLVVSLTLFGLLMVYDVSQAEAVRDFADRFYYFNQQVRWVIIGFFALIITSFIDHRIYKKYALPFLIFSLVLLLLVFIPGLGVLSGGAYRWLKIFGLSIQPMEVIKLSAIIYLAAVFEKGPKTLPLVLILSFVSIVVGIFQRDLGSVIVFAMIGFSLYFLAGARILYLSGTLVLGALSAVIVISISAYRRARLMSFFDPFSDPTGYSYHVAQVLIAIGSGGLFGLGIGQSRQKFTYIPEVATDSIFSIIGEELGFIGCFILIAVFAYLLFRGFKIAQNASSSFGMYLGMGLVIWLGSQIIINLAAMVSLIPLTGVPLPFISYGGSALLLNLIAAGILLNISRSSG